MAFIKKIVFLLSTRKKFLTFLKIKKKSPKYFKKEVQKYFFSILINQTYILQSFRIHINFRKFFEEFFEKFFEEFFHEFFEEFFENLKLKV